MATKEEILAGLNDNQRLSAQYYNGPNFTTAGAGSGKTKTIIAKAQIMILDGVDPSEICLFTFTNKAANEIKERVIDIIGDKGKNITVGTYHSICNRILRKYGKAIGYLPSFTILSQEDSEKIIKKLAKSYAVDPDLVIHFISKSKSNVILPQAAILGAENETQRIMGQVYQAYQDELFRQQAMDFDDLLLNTIRILENNSDIKKAINKQWKYIIADEFQDSSNIDVRLITLLGGENEHISCYFDDFQCLTADTQITMADGTKKAIENIKVNDKLLIAAGRGQTTIAPVSSLSKKKINEKIYEITTESGKFIKATKNHIFFSSFINNKDNKVHYVYLMQKKSKGFRIGRTSSYRVRKKQQVNGFEVRLNQETGDRIWILEVCDNIKDAMYYEAYYSYKYGIPQYVFFNRQAEQLMSNELISKLYNEINTTERALQLLKDKNMFLDYPHYTPKAITKVNDDKNDNRRKLNFIMFGGNKSNRQRNFSHKLTANTIDEKYADMLNEYAAIYNCKMTNSDNMYYNFVKNSVDYDSLFRITNEIENKMIDKNFEISYSARLTNDTLKLNFTPASHLRVGMSLPVLKDNEIILDTISSVKEVTYNDYVYDINIDNFRNYIANDIVVHNCIFGFRNADIDLSVNILKRFPRGKMFNLDKNYRCSQTIVEASKSLIAKNKVQVKKKVTPAREYKGSPIIITKCKNSADEASKVIQYVKMLNTKYDVPYSEIAILYRMSYLSRMLEQAFMSAKIPYQIVGGLPFFARLEIQDILSYVKLTVNEFDVCAFKRSIQIPKRGIGDKTIEKIDDFARTYPGGPISIREALKKIDLKGKNGKETKASLAVKEYVDFLELLDKKKVELPPDEFITFVVKELKYLDYLEETKNIRKEESIQSRIENLMELVNVAKDYNDVEDLLVQASLFTKEDSEEDREKVQLMTMHASKGLEFTGVIMVGMTDGTSPHHKAMGNAAQMEEERRLCYVGITRAKDYLFMLHAEQMMVQGRLTYAKPSRFLNEIDKKYVYKN